MEEREKKRLRKEEEGRGIRGRGKQGEEEIEKGIEVEKARE